MSGSEGLKGLAVPTYFVNKIVAADGMGPCVRFVLGAATDADRGDASPDLCVIWDAAALLSQMDTVSDIVHAVMARLETMTATGIRVLS